MKVFMSWSGDRSREVAKLLDYWIKCVVQATKPWISTSGIDSGSIWFNQINSELQDTTFGIICLTKENKNAPWILFESGALAKGLASSRVCTFLIDLDTKDVRDPLAQFNHTLPSYESMWKLVSTLNGNLPEVNRLEVTILKGVFEIHWPQFKEKFDAIITSYPETTVVEPRKQEDILTEILESTRGLERRMRSVETRANATMHEREASYTSAWKQHIKMSPNDPAVKQHYVENAAKHLLEGKTLQEVETMLLNTPGVTIEHAIEIMAQAMQMGHVSGTSGRN
jgi:hypothetical protein